MEYGDEALEQAPLDDMLELRHKVGARQKTRADHNRQQRKRELQQATERKESVKKQRRDMDNLQILQADIVAQEDHNAARSLRRQVHDVPAGWECVACITRCRHDGNHTQVERAEKASVQAPRLGRRRYKAEPLQVLLSEDAEHGSLRQLKPAAALAGATFKSLQKHGLVEPF